MNVIADSPRRWSWSVCIVCIVIAGCAANNQKVADHGDGTDERTPEVDNRGAKVDERIPVESLDDLPRHTYQLEGTAWECVQDDAQFERLARKVRADIESDLAKYRIEDETTLQRMHGTLLTLDMLDKNYDDALVHVKRLRELEDKESARLTIGLTTESYIKARRAGGDDAKFAKVFRDELLERVRELPWDICGDQIEQSKGRAEIISANLIEGMVQSQLEPVIRKNEGKISADIAQSIVGIRFRLTHYIPLKPHLVAVYAQVVEENRIEKDDIWPDRDVVLSKDEGRMPVVVAIWDSGVDVDIFDGLVWTNVREQQNRQDDDGNGFVDDVHGIAYDLDANPTPHLLHPLDGMTHDVDEIARFMKGYLDVQAAIDSPEASAVKKKLGSLARDEVKPFIEDLNLFGNYTHGTHVAGIAAAGNPFIRLLVSRLTFDWHLIPYLPTVERSVKEAASMRTSVNYFQEAGVRVVNMSWGGNRASIEAALEANGWGESAEERAEMARKLFKIERDALYAAIKSAPDILFVTSAGNADNDVEFDEMIPSGFDLPNLLVVGAVDQAGDPTDFTSFGRTVGVYANGFEVDSYIPGGKRMKFSGTSMSSPNVVNLAAKILAVDPGLSPTEVIDLIRRGSDKVAGPQPMLLINPKKTLELAKG